jgi:hypothetical protein
MWLALFYVTPENFEFDTGNFTDSFRFDARLKLFEFTLKNLYRREI